MSNTTNYYCEDCGEPRPSGKAIRIYCPKHLKENTTTDTWKEEFDCRFAPGAFDSLEQFGDGHYCTHHPDDPAHGQDCYNHPVYKPLKSWIANEISLAEKRGAERVIEVIWQDYGDVLCHQTSLKELKSKFLNKQ